MPNKTAVITGAGKGIGRATALRFAGEGVNLALFTRTDSDYDSMRPELDKAGVQYLTYAGDLGNDVQVEEFANLTRQKFPDVAYLINNAAVFQKVELRSSRLEDFDRMMSVNIRGSYLMTRSFVNDMIRRGDGVILFVSSIAGLTGFKGGSLYSASKFAIQGMADSLMREVREYGVRVATVCPGNVKTAMWERESEPKPEGDSIIQPEDVADSIWHACNMPANTMVRHIELRSTHPAYRAASSNRLTSTGTGRPPRRSRSEFRVLRLAQTATILPNNKLRGPFFSPPTDAVDCRFEDLSWKYAFFPAKTRLTAYREGLYCSGCLWGIGVKKFTISEP
jgi:3-oxoacyl-[acyl-carrier protein] reductase